MNKVFIVALPFLLLGCSLLQPSMQKTFENSVDWQVWYPSETSTSSTDLKFVYKNIEQTIIIPEASDGSKKALSSTPLLFGDLWAVDLADAGSSLNFLFRESKSDEEYTSQVVIGSSPTQARYISSVDKVAMRYVTQVDIIV